ncbi:insulinase family protein [Anaerocolumna jejuensis]|uniref:insulinase family protein n=1 Tax=Anaerocolumna jejuensis TaxID=259063 RepID=UPI003F7C8EF8
MEKKLSLTLVLILVLSLCFSPHTAASASQTALIPLPETGEMISGFKTVETGDMALINSKSVLFEHEKTGAKLLYIQNKDMDRSFDISFKTPALDNAGAIHVLEHMSISCSNKYPLKDLIFAILNQTYSTYANAYTRQNFTTYPVSSLSEEQLLKLTDVYLDSVYHPSVSNSKNLFSREAWRYELPDANAPLTLTGTVYNEMKGDLGNISSAAGQNVLHALFPGSIQSNIAAGIPDNIKELTYEQVMNFRNTYYHPSNSLMVLYGNVDYRRFLKHINDEFLSKYDKKEIAVETGKIAPLKEKAERTVKFPVAASSNTKNSSQIDYAFAFTDISEEDTVGLGILADILNQETSPVMEALKKSDIGGSYSVSFDAAFTQPILTFSAANADESKKAEFKMLIDNSMSNIISTGFDKTAVDAVISNTLLTNSNLAENRNTGVNLSMKIASMWANHGSLDYYNHLIKNIKTIKDKAEDNYFEKLLKKYIENNNHAALAITVPEAGLAEKLANTEKKHLSDLKAAMSKQELDKITADTKAYNEWNNQLPDPKIVESLQAVKIADLPEEVKTYKTNDSFTSDGVRLLSAEANVGETETSSLLFDTSAVPMKKLHYLQLYADLFGKLSTKNYTQKQLNTQKLRYLNNAEFHIANVTQNNARQYTPYFSISWMGIASEYDKQLSLVKEILLNTNFDNSKALLNLVRAQVSNLKSQYTNDPLSILLLRNLAQIDESSTYQNYISGLDYYNFLLKLEKDLVSNPKAAAAELKNINALILNKTNLVTTYAGNKNTIKNYEDSIKIITDALPKKKITSQDYGKLPKPALREGIAVDSTVQYNAISASYKKMGVAFTGKLLPIQTLIDQNYITPKLRFGYGAYVSIVSFNSNGILAASYRDPNIKETFEVYKGLPAYIKNMDLTQETLDRFILNAFSDYSAPRGELAGAESALLNCLSGEKAEDKLKILHEIKSTTVQDVKDSFAMFQSFIKNGSYSTVGSKQKLLENKDLFDEILSIK